MPMVITMTMHVLLVVVNCYKPSIPTIPFVFRTSRLHQPTVLLPFLGNLKEQGREEEENYLLGIYKEKIAINYASLDEFRIVTTNTTIYCSSFMPFYLCVCVRRFSPKKRIYI